MSQAIPPNPGVPRAFWGEHRCPLDAEGRLSLPEDFLGKGEFVLTKGLDGCLMLAPQAFFASLSQKVRELPFTRRSVRAFRRHLYASATPVTSDSHNRIIIPENLRAYAGLTETAVVVGNDAYLEIWNEQAWEEMTQTIERMVQEEGWQLEGI
ncbi:MAG TPA: division/cell wall cluster transcriptional repressor MraZ [Anaerolineae bacterium]|nr:division/cell wall cluster transcriptional repressor MraZ [Anaerolineae bacterium]